MRDRVRAAWLVAMLLGVTNQGLAQEYEDEPETYAADPEMGDVSSARPTSIPGPLTVYGGARLGLGGNAEYDPGGADDMVATFGLQVGGDYVLMDHFALGGELRLGRFGTDFYDEVAKGRSTLLDFVVRPRGRYVFEGMPLEAFGTLPFGLTIPVLNDDWNADGKAGFTLGFGAGANYFITDKLGFGGEMSYLLHWIGWSDSTVAGAGPTPDADVTLGQLNFIANVIYAL